ncbi:MAG: amidohydrolase family protein [Candidatus Obscuribacterales bacterium]|nr:amidohydrolase family protein [Candidatus Obscuribacterales bacterium]
MRSLLITGAMLVTPLEERITDVRLESDKIAQIGGGRPDSDFKEIDGSDCYLTPGLFDLQVNGGPGCDFWEELSWEKIAAFSRRLLDRGLTSILPTFITGDLGRLKANRDFLKAQLGLERSGEKPLVRMPGIHFEGPCLSPQKSGVHPPQHLKALEVAVLKEFVDESCSLITIAPELDPSFAAISYLQERGILCSLGHSNASFEEARAAFERGVKLMTHTFNALPPMHHRQPGAVAAALLDPNVSCCVIPDGLHLHPAMVELIIKTKGVDKTIMVSDIASIGTSQGGLVGSSLILDQGVRNLVKWGACTFGQALQMSAYNPARLLGLEDQIGQIKVGAFADLILWDRKTLEIKEVIFNGLPLAHGDETHALGTLLRSASKSEK